MCFSDPLPSSAQPAGDLRSDPIEQAPCSVERSQDMRVRRRGTWAFTEDPFQPKGSRRRLDIKGAPLGSPSIMIS